MHQKVDHLHYKNSILRWLHMQVVDGHVVPDATCWVEARALQAWKFCVIPLSVGYLIRLIDIGSVIDAVLGLAVLPEARQMQDKIYREGKGLHVVGIQLYSEEIHANSDSEKFFSSEVQIIYWSFLSFFYICKVPVKISSFIKGLILVKIGKNAFLCEGMIERGVCLPAPVVQGPIGWKVCSKWSHTSLMILQVVKLFREAVDEVVDEIVESIFLVLTQLFLHGISLVLMDQPRVLFGI